MNTLHDPVRTAIDDGVATVTFAFPGPAVNALTLPGLGAIVGACAAAAACPDVEIVVVTTDAPDGFCPGYAASTLDHLGDPDDRRAFAVAGQRLLTRLADLPVVTVAVVPGPCRGPGYELALACYTRLAVARADSWVGLGPDALPAWGGTARAPDTTHNVMTAREAVKTGAFHDAFTTRRAKIELQQWLDKLQRHSVKPRRGGSWFGPTLAERLAAERAAFARVGPGPVVAAPVSIPLPDVVGAWGLSPASAAVVADVAARGRRAVVVPRGGHEDSLASAFARGLDRGRWTPLEAEQARARVTVTNDPGALAGAGWVVPAAPGAPVASRAAPGTILGWYALLGLDPPSPPVADAPPRRRLAAA